MISEQQLAILKRVRRDGYADIPVVYPTSDLPQAKVYQKALRLADRGFLRRASLNPGVMRYTLTPAGEREMERWEG